MNVETGELIRRLNLAENEDFLPVPNNLKESLRKMMGEDFIQEWPEELRKC